MSLFSAIGSLFSPVGALIGGVADTALGWAGESQKNSANLEQIRATNEAQKELAKYKYDLDLEQWHRENFYNTPQAQMQRLAEAGLNPHLMYQQGSTGQAAPSPAYAMSNLQAYQMDASPLSVLSGKIGKTAEQVIDYYLREQKQIGELKSLEYDNDLKKAYAVKASADAAVAIAKEAETVEDTTLKRTLNKYADELQAAQVSNQWASFDNTVANTSYLTEQVELAKAQVVSQRAAANLSQAQAAAAYELCKVHKATLSKIAQDIATGKAQEAYYRLQAVGQEINNDWNRKFGTNAPWWTKLIDGFMSNPDDYINRIGLFIDNISTKLSGKSPSSGQSWSGQFWNGFNKSADMMLRTLPGIGLGYTFSDWIYRKFQ